MIYATKIFVPIKTESYLTNDFIDCIFDRCKKTSYNNIIIHMIFFVLQSIRTFVNYYGTCLVVYKIVSDKNNRDCMYMVAVGASKTGKYIFNKHVYPILEDAIRACQTIAINACSNGISDGGCYIEDNDNEVVVVDDDGTATVIENLSEQHSGEKLIIVKSTDDIGIDDILEKVVREDVKY